MKNRRAMQIGAPIVAVATMMIGLRVGAKSAVRAATVFGAPVGMAPPGGKARLAWQVLTYLDDRGVRETIAMQGLHVIGRSKGAEARWDGASNEDGIAEIALELPDLKTGDPVDLEIRVDGDSEPLASGTVAWHDVAWARSEPNHVAAVRPTSRSGTMNLDVVIEGGRLVVGFPTPLWVRSKLPAGAHGRVTVDASPEPGLVFDRESVTSCEDGWAEFSARAMAHVTGGSFHARALGDPNVEGKWFGALPVAPGAFFVSVPRVMPAGTPNLAVLVAPNPRKVVYAEVDDVHGRVIAAALPVETDPTDTIPRARFELPPLASGLHWLVVSGEPRGAEHLAGAAIARPFFVGTSNEVDVQNACSIGPWLASHEATGFPRWIALDGLPARSRANRGRHFAGLLIAGVSLLAAGLLEVLLLTAAAREARVAMQLAELDELDPEAKRVTAKPPGGGLAVAVLVVLLGFALLAALLVAKA
ncbi:hypothetical protein AKJ09_03398 [Labilithrix luteola]|uniref:Uncharacterized protein n=1 Tax=Labilithrix luteola TaxID=1391654 RepID=A0A0K1PUE7_9BACT|nr:hypothetical protein [Labilithrix luteola]AKU96734.1 hypothetical protein AKJ09_03398 [Labilithrix luteola]